MASPRIATVAGDHNMPAKLRDPNPELSPMQVAVASPMAFSSTICGLLNAGAMPESSSGLEAEAFPEPSAGGAANACSFAKAAEAGPCEALAKCCAESSAVRSEDWAAVHPSGRPWQHRNLLKGRAALADHCALGPEALARAAVGGAARGRGPFELDVAHRRSALAGPWMLGPPAMHGAASRAASGKASPRVAGVACGRARLPTS
mmetsp:Transcript_162320/g.515701  ORF Transcript_162320/g.515701 Transcript_162320/m.515701 type:complete len:205 (-) Transcript_162320:90-704(-)